MNIFINPYTDFGFKRLFGGAAGKPGLISFLNSLLPRRRCIADLEYFNPELSGESPNERKTIFDLFCKSVSGEYFILEMQRGNMVHFKDRSVYYVCNLLRSQALRSAKWNFKLAPVCFVGILDFVMKGEEEDFRIEVSPKRKPRRPRPDGKKHRRKEPFCPKMELISCKCPCFANKRQTYIRFSKNGAIFLKNCPTWNNSPKFSTNPSSLMRQSASN